MAILEITDPTTTTTEATTTTTEGMSTWNIKIRKKFQGKNLFLVNIVVQRTFLNSRSLQFDNLFRKYTLLLCWRNMWMLRRFIYSNFWNKCHSRILQLRRNVLYWWLMQKYVFLFRYHVIRSEVALYKAHFLIRLDIFYGSSSFLYYLQLTEVLPLGQLGHVQIHATPTLLVHRHELEHVRIRNQRMMEQTALGLFQRAEPIVTKVVVHIWTSTYSIHYLKSHRKTVSSPFDTFV